MDRELLDHAARVLQHTPAHILDAGALYDRVRRETGIECGISLFLVRLQAASHRFALLPGPADLDPLGAWSDVERMAYTSGLAAAGLSRWPLVTLCESVEPGQSPDPGSHSPDTPPAPRDSIGPAAAADSLGDVHRSVAELLRSAAGDPLLRDAVGTAVAALDTALSGTRPATRKIPPQRRAGAGAARSTTPPRRPPPPR